ncbi:MAG: hypothetical protein E6Q27_09145 [Aeromicrobium sp.]|nr:MAG: hypothetical protein E6Q27_09145 [Aeromicrobium sp.]
MSTAVATSPEIERPEIANPAVPNPKARHKRASSKRTTMRTPPVQTQPHGLTRGHRWHTSTSVYAPEQMPLPIPVPRTLLPAPVERGNGQTGELRHRSARFMQAIAEVIAGIRPTRQLSPWLTREVHTQLSTYVNTTFSATTGPTRQRVQIVSVHLFMVNEDTAEIAARMVLRGRSHAIAARLQHVNDPRERSVWRCTALEWA